uniref:Uncharacterized protein n=1 Tax=Meloidogyne enterolobii TaxID=390850 RepID=A0A6V7VK02_MELEN|nr:unnamed protein product [Meloidogyne enterolobii]
MSHSIWLVELKSNFVSLRSIISLETPKLVSIFYMVGYVVKKFWNYPLIT